MFDHLCADRYWQERPDDLLMVVQNGEVCLNFHSVMRKDGFRQRFFGRFNHPEASVCKTWYQLPEYILRKYLKPACVRDLYEVALPHEAHEVRETGNIAPESSSTSCLRDCMSMIVPSDDVEVHEELLKWLPPKNLKSGLRPVFFLNAISTKYQYRISKMKHTNTDSLMDEICAPNNLGQKHEDIIIRPVTASGMRCNFCLF